MKNEETILLLDRLYMLAEKYEEFVQHGPWGRGEHIWSPEDIDSFLPEHITCGKDAETALDMAWFKYSGEYELIPVIVEKIKKIRHAETKQVSQYDGLMAFTFDDNADAYSDAA